MLDWLQDNAELIISAASGGTIVGLATQARKLFSDKNDAEDEFLGRVMDRLETVEGRCDTMQRQQSRMSERIIELSRERDALRKQLNAVEERAEKAEKTVAELRAKIDAKNREIHQLQTRLGRLEERGEPIE